MQTPEKVMILLSIVGRNKGKRLISTLDKVNIKMHLQTTGFGTAPTEMMDILGLSDNDKDIVISFGAKSAVRNLMAKFGDSFESHSAYGGIIMVMKTNAVNRLTAEILHRYSTQIPSPKEDDKMTSNHKHSLLIINVAQGFSDEVMHTAKKAGAMGGTILKGRFAGADYLKEVANIDTDEEREVILIMAPFDTASEIMEEVNKEYGLRSEAQGTMCLVPVEKAYKI